jgi:integrase/recombinase XerD
MKISRFGKAEVLRPDQINLLFNEGFVKPRDKALFGVCLYAACRINEACTLFTRDVLGSNGIRQVLLVYEVAISNESFSYLPPSGIQKTKVF